MQILYFLLVISFVALVWAAVSITRHIRHSAADHTTQNEPIDTILKKPIAKHDLGNTDYRSAANRTRSAPTKS